MKYPGWLFILFFCLLSGAQAVEIETKAKMDSLENEADAVVLSEEDVFTVEDDDEATLVRKVRILIKNKKADDYCTVHIGESQYVSADDIEAAIYTEEGKRIKELDDDNIRETSISPGFILYQGHKTKYFTLRHHTYPYILEYSYELEFNTLFFWPDWKPQWDIPCRLSSFKLVLEEEIAFKTYAIGQRILPEKRVEHGDSVYFWRATNIPERIEEDFLPPEYKTQLAVLMAPKNFTLGKSRGSTESWQAFGNWYRDLALDRYQLKPAAQAEVLKGIQGAASKKEKIQRLYKFMQEKTRYVAVEIGIGGYQPYSATSTFLNCYGDCKDLTTLMVGMLRVAGIAAYPALALTRDKGIVYADFPSNQFNHAILFVPLAVDTLWLECTADFLDITDLPYHIQGINALVIMEDGGHLLQTPVPPAESNSWRSKSIARITPGNSLKVQSVVYTSGNQKRYFQTLKEYGDTEDEKNALQKAFAHYVPNFGIDSYLMRTSAANASEMEIRFAGTYRKVIKRIGSRLLLNPALFNRKTKANIPDDEERHFPVRFNYPYCDVDTVVIHIPSGYSVEYAPPPADLETPFARFVTEHHFEGQELTYIRHFTYKSIHFPAQQYPQFLDFIRQVVAVDKEKFVFKKGM